METILLNSNKGYNNILGYLEPLTMKIKKSIYKLEENNKTFEYLKVKVIYVNDLGEKLHKGCVRALQGSL